MALTATANWLNTAFAGYDRLILSLLHAVGNGFFTFLFKLITLIGEKGLVFFLAAIVLMCFPKTRKLGVCIFGAVCCGALITNIILKDAVARPRPLTVSPYSEWWAEIKAPAEDGWSFPSGHVTAAAAGMVAIRLMKGKKWMVPAVVWVLLMMIARNYLMAHYPSDVLAAAIIGTASGFISYYITRFIFQFLYINRRKNWCGVVLNWSAPDYKGIPSKLGLTGEPENDYFAKPFGRSAEAPDKQEKDPNRKPLLAVVSKKLSSVKNLIPAKKTASQEENKPEGQPTEEGTAEEILRQEINTAPSENASPSENTAPIENSAPADNSAPAQEEKEASAPARRSHLSLSKPTQQSKTRASSGYQGKHVK